MISDWKLSPPAALPGWRIVLLILTMGVVGCGHGSGETLSEVRGVVTYYGRPVAADVVFQPIDRNGIASGRPSRGRSQANGKYSLHFTPSESGAVVGPHLVTVIVLPFANSGEPALLYDARKPLKQARLLRVVKPVSAELNFAITN